MIDRYVFRPRPRPDARVRLICFAPAGYGASIYREWGRDLPQHIDVWAVRLPGRENVRGERLVTDFAQLVEFAERITTPLLDRSFALFGHSMGSCIAFELARRLRETPHCPSHLFVSGRRAPHVTSARTPIHALPDDEFIAEIQRRYNGIPQAVLMEPELLSMTLPVLRADLAALHSYSYTPGPPLLNPISCFAGSEDHDLVLSDLDAWRVHSTAAFEVTLLPGGHFYLTGSSRANLLEHIARHL